jgi:hypothetical protein
VVKTRVFIVRLQYSQCPSAGISGACPKIKINQKFLQGVQGDGFLEKSPPMLHGAEGLNRSAIIHAIRKM